MAMLFTKSYLCLSCLVSSLGNIASAREAELRNDRHHLKHRERDSSGRGRAFLCTRNVTICDTSATTQQVATDGCKRPPVGSRPSPRAAPTPAVRPRT